MEETRKPVNEHVARRAADSVVRVGILVMVPLIFHAEALEARIIPRQLLDVHAPTDLTPEIEHAELLLLAHPTPAETRVPADRLENERGENVEEIGIGDLKAPVKLIHLAEGATAAV